MKKTLTAVAAALLFTAPAYAVDEHHPEGQPPAQAEQKAVERMQENTTKMQVQLDRIAKAETPQERQKLLMEHMQTMRENMMLGQQMATGGMGCPMMGMMGAGGPAGEPDAMMNRMQQMERRMDMMQMMMERQMGAQPSR